MSHGQRKRFADGKVIVPFKRFLGYGLGRGWEPCHKRRTGGGRPEDLRDVPAGTLPICHRKGADGGGHPDSGRQEKLVGKHGPEHPHERKIQRGCAPPESVHGGFPFQKEKGQRGRDPAVLCGE